MRRAARSAALPGGAADRLEELRRRAAASRGGAGAYFDDGDDERGGGAGASAGGPRGGGGAAYARPGGEDDDDDDDDDPVRVEHKPRDMISALAAGCCACGSWRKPNPNAFALLLAPPAGAGCRAGGAAERGGADAAALPGRLRADGQEGRWARPEGCACADAARSCGGRGARGRPGPAARGRRRRQQRRRGRRRRPWWRRRGRRQGARPV